MTSEDRILMERINGHLLSMHKVHIGDESGQHIYGGNLEGVKALTVLLEHPQSRFRKFWASMRGARSFIHAATITTPAEKKIRMAVHGVINADFCSNLIKDLREKFPEHDIDFSEIETQVRHVSRRADLYRKPSPRRQ